MTYLKKEKPITRERFDLFKFEAQGWKFYQGNMIIFNQKISYVEAIVFLIRQKYSLSDEIAILRQRDIKPNEFAEYNIFVESCKTEAKNFIEERRKFFLE